MPDPFDPAEFDAPPPSDPGADYRTLLDAMRKAGAEGVAQQAAALSRQIEQEARQRAEAGQQTQNALNELLRAAAQLQRVNEAIGWERLKGWLYAALIGLGLIFIPLNSIWLNCGWVRMARRSKSKALSWK